jgi:hypothetical protein
MNDPNTEAFAARLRQAVPAPSEVAIEDILYQAGFRAALQQSPPARSRWTPFVAGMCSGGLAAGVIWLCSAIPLQPSPSMPASDLGMVASSPTSVAQPRDVALNREGDGTVRADGAGDDVSTPPTNPFWRPSESELFRSSLNQVSKHQWDQRRLSERTRWVSAPTVPSASTPEASNANSPSSSLWQLRGRSGLGSGL